MSCPAPRDETICVWTERENRLPTADGILLRAINPFALARTREDGGASSSRKSFIGRVSNVILAAICAGKNTDTLQEKKIKYTGPHSTRTTVSYPTFYMEEVFIFFLVL